MEWIDCQKAYDVVSHSWIAKCLDVFGGADGVKTLLVNSWDKWRVMLYSGNMELGEFEIRRGIFQEDSLSPLVFVLGLIQLVLILKLFLSCQKVKRTLIIFYLRI